MSIIEVTESLHDVVRMYPPGDVILPGKELLDLDKLLLFTHGLFLSQDMMFDTEVRIEIFLLLS